MKNPVAVSSEDACNSIRYHVTNLIQPRYVFLAFNPQDLLIAAASDNAAGLLHTEAGALLGRRIGDLIDEESVARIAALLGASGDCDGNRGRTVTGLTIRRSGVQCEAVIFPSGRLACVEILQRSQQLVRDFDLWTDFSGIAEKLVDYQDAPHALADWVCQEIRKITGLDRVYYCEFDTAGHGYVSAESGNGKLPALIDHRFPNTDIPASLRPLYVKNRFRCIADTTAKPARILGADGGIDLTYSIARYPGETHLGYLANMGVRASTSFSVVADGQLIGILGGHHVEPISLSYRQLLVCQQLVMIYQSRYAVLNAQSMQRRYDSYYTAKVNLIRLLEAEKFELRSLFEAPASALCSLTEADHVICRFEGVDYGNLPDSGAFRSELLGLLSERLRGEQSLVTHALKDLAPRFAEHKSIVSGVLAVPLDSEANNLIVWTRKEQIYEEKWSGDPNQAISIDEYGKVGPRKSFATWVRQVAGTSRPWDATSLKVALNFKNLLNQALISRYHKLAADYANQANEHKSMFLANMTHELRTPLHTIIMLVKRMLKKGELPEPRRQHYLSSVLDSSERLMQLINNLLDLSKLEAGGIALNLVTGDMLDTINLAREQASGVLQKKALAVEINSNGSDTRLVFDQEKMAQVFINLFANAAKFSEHAGRIDVNLLREYGEKPLLRIEVVDHGCGIAEDELELIFGKFEQSRHSRNGAGGTGLGLSICRQILALHGGEIWAQNSVPHGATFVVTVPTTVVPENLKAEAVGVSNDFA